MRNDDNESKRNQAAQQGGVARLKGFLNEFERRYPGVPYITLDLGHSLSEEERVQGMLGREPAHLEGTRAFLEKRTPDFRDPAP